MEEKRKKNSREKTKRFFYLYWQCIKVYYLSIFRNSYPTFPLWSHQNKLWCLLFFINALSIYIYLGCKNKSWASLWPEWGVKQCKCWPPFGPCCQNCHRTKGWQHKSWRGLSSSTIDHLTSVWKISTLVWVSYKYIFGLALSIALHSPKSSHGRIVALQLS